MEDTDTLAPSSISTSLASNSTNDYLLRLLRSTAVAGGTVHENTATARSNAPNIAHSRRTVSSIDPVEIKSLEYATIRVPYEVVNKRYRVVQKTIDRDLHRTNINADELMSCLQSNEWDSASRQADQLLQHLTTMKRKVGEIVDDETSTLKSCRRRLEHLKNFDGAVDLGANSKSVTAEQFHRIRVNRMLVDYLLRMGYYDAANMLASQADIIDLSNAEIFLSAKEIEESLHAQQTQLCLQWCQDNKSKLKRVQSALEFHLRQQEAIELIKAGNGKEAVAHVRTHMIKGNDDIPNAEAEIQKTMGLFTARIKRSSSNSAASQLVFSSVERYRDLLSDLRWDKLIVEFRQNLLQIYQLNEQCSFITALKAGLAALKTTTCFSTNADDKIDGCPACDVNLNVWAETVPFSHCSNSRLVCGISGEPINEENRALMMPNGHVYGEHALHTMAAKSSNGQTVKCPRTHSLYLLSELQRVYVM